MAIAIEPDQLEEVDFTYPIILAQLKMIVPAEVEESRLFAFVRPFQPLVNVLKNHSLFKYKINVFIYRFEGLVTFHRLIDQWIVNRQRN